jgi:hypothetical protein
MPPAIDRPNWNTEASKIAELIIEKALRGFRARKHRMAAGVQGSVRGIKRAVSKQIICLAD